MKRIHHWFVIVRSIKVWQLVLLLIVLLALSAFFLRQNNLNMVELREQVKQADAQNGDVKQALLNLQHYVSSHMNTSLGDGIALQHTYERAYTAAVESAAHSTNPNAALYAQVELECRPVFQRTNSFPAYTQCAHERLSQLAPGQDALAAIETPPPELYRFNFVSPLWSPDVAGFMVLLAVLAGFLLVARIAAYLVLRAILHAHR